jgi:hypothetical protein
VLPITLPQPCASCSPSSFIARIPYCIIPTTGNSIGDNRTTHEHQRQAHLLASWPAARLLKQVGVPFELLLREDLRRAIDVRRAAGDSPGFILRMATAKAAMAVRQIMCGIAAKTCALGRYHSRV